MSEIQRLEQKRDQILNEIRGIRAMRKGSVIEQYLKGRKKGQEEPVLRGPYFLYTRKEKGKTIGLRLKKNEADRFRQEVEAFHRFQSLCDEYALVTEKLGDIEREGGSESQEKKRPKSRSKKKRK